MVGHLASSFQGSVSADRADSVQQGLHPPLLQNPEHPSSQDGSDDNERQKGRQADRQAHNETHRGRPAISSVGRVGSFEDARELRVVGHPSLEVRKVDLEGHPVPSRDGAGGHSDRGSVCDVIQDCEVEGAEVDGEVGGLDDVVGAVPNLDARDFGDGRVRVGLQSDSE